MSNHSKGFVILPRSVFDSWVFTDPFVFYCWMDITRSANFHDAIQVVKMQKITVKRGQWVASQRFLAQRWNCSLGKVNKVLKMFIDEQMISVNREHSISLITVDKYDDYQDLSQYREQTMNKKRTKAVTQIDTKRNNINNINNITSEETSQKLDKVVNEVSELIDSFKVVNPTAFKRWFGNKTQRAASQDLLDNYSLEQIKRVIKVLPQTNKKQYYPTITTPLQLRDKWSALEAAFVSQKQDIKRKITVI